MVVVTKFKLMICPVAFLVAMTISSWSSTWAASNNPVNSKPPVVSTPSKNQVKPAVIDPEQEPLSAYEAHHEKARQASGRSIGRLLLGLFAVLSLFGAFARWGLPRLVERYPQFFAYWQRYSAGKETAEKGLLNTVESQVKNSLDDAVPGLLHSSGTLRLLSSTLLNTSQELHLVEVGERQLIIVSTPDGVSILCDLTVPVQKPFANSPHNVQDLFPAKAEQKPLSEADTSLKASDSQSLAGVSAKKLNSIAIPKNETLNVSKHKPYACPAKSKSYFKVVPAPMQKVSSSKSEMSIELLGDYDDIF